MRQVWFTLTLVAFAAVLASTVEAQRWSQVRNMNTHEGKYSTGGFGFSAGVGGAGGASFRREALSTSTVDGGLEAVFKKRQAQNQTRLIFGADIDFQIGSDNSVIGTDFGIEIYNFSLGTTATRSFDNDAFENISKSATLIYVGFDFTINLYESEFIETDGRRTREKWGMSLIFGPKVGLLFGDFSDINGFASIGLDIGLMFDFPIPVSGAEDLLSISPFAFLEANYRNDVDGGLIDGNPASDTVGQEVLNDNFDLGFYGETDLDGNPDTGDGIAVRRHAFIPAYQFNIGFDFNITPIFVSRSGGLINNWRFNFSVVGSAPLQVDFLFANYNGDSLQSSDEIPYTFTVSFGASYFW